jgi:peptide/nickel transport system substrate-binding protein/oligopeptide transport system substrate-binding protein
MKTTTKIVTISLLFCVLLASCQSTAESQADPPKPEDRSQPQSENQAQEPQANDENMLVVSLSPPKINLDPLHTFTSTEAQIYTAIYEGLVTYHPFTLEPMPAVAEYWEISSDRKTYRFHIRESARYWNGDQVEPEHFRDTWLALINPANPGEYGSLLDIIKGARDYRLRLNDDPTSVGITVPEPGILQVELEKPAPHFLKILCHHSFSPLHPKMLEVKDWSNMTTVLGNGPFTIVESNDTEMVLKKNQLYWDSNAVHLDGINIVYSDDGKWAARSIDNGTLHWAEGNVDFDILENKEAMILNPVFSTTYFFFSSSSSQSESYNNPQLRRALGLLVPWDEVRSTQYMYLPTDSLVPQISGYPTVHGIAATDSETAMKLLDEAGFSDGKGLPEIKFLIPEGTEAQRIADLMAEAWRKALGVKVTIENAGFGDYYERIKNEDFTLGVLTWVGDFADPLSFLQMWTSDAALNVGKYHNDRYDAMVSEAATEENEIERYKEMATAEQLLLDDATVLPIKHAPAFNIIDLDRVRGWFPNPLDIHPFKYLEFEQFILPDGVV